MSKIRGCNSYCFNLIAHFIEHLPKILESSGVRKLCKCFFCLFSTQINITQSHHICKTCIIKLFYNLPASVSYSYMCQINLLIGSHYSTVACCIHFVTRSEEHTSELQSRPHLVCRLLLE